MTYEVEQKFRLADRTAVESRLQALGCQIEPAIEQVDSYFAHPARDFGQTDEALRMRRTGSKNFVTYKGPRIDATTKTRREIDLALPAGRDYAKQFQALLEALGFRLVADVHKLRRKGWLPWQGAQIEISLDEVTGVGSFVELEVIADEAEVETAKQGVASLATQLGLSDAERRSYLELLLSAAGP